ncbi:hypothetical protein [Desulfobotulus sp.]|uniref:hypothetical protein n=1 Tax=Desulfobotulus sp. TaxID=1940337 RepID=UPI002A36B62A|nr:hypothetical protein [Desulfobotulus sp.]MDY0162167.1 hypothetical protein [Desulfobotulus sp.]
MGSEDEKNKQQRENARLQREVRSQRKFTLAEAIGREGGNFMKGHNPIPALDQIIAKLQVFLENHLQDSSRILLSVLQKTLKENDLQIAQHMESPFEYLHMFIGSHIETPALLHELTRQVDLKWGQIHNEKPFFQKPGEPPHPEDPYSHESVEQKLRELLEKIESVRETKKE